VAREPIQQNNMEKFPWIQRRYYLEQKIVDLGGILPELPEEFPEDSEAAIQWRYNPRTKESREYFNATFGWLKKLHANKEQARKSEKKARNQKKGT